MRTLDYPILADPTNKLPSLALGTDLQEEKEEHRYSKLKQIPGGGVLNKVLYGEAPPRVPNLYPFLYPF